MLPDLIELCDFAARYTAAWCSHSPERALLGPNTTVSWKVSKAEVAKSGDLGYLYGTYSLLIKDPQGLPVHDTGKLVEIWKKQADGNWKCIVDTYNSDLPVAAASEKK